MTSSPPHSLRVRGRALALVLVLVVVAAAAGATVLTGIWDPDFFHHLAVGRALARGTSFAAEPFLWPMAGVPSGVPQYWLGSLALYVASLPAGPPGAVVLVALLAAALFSVLLLDALDGHREPHRVLVAVALVALVLPEIRIRSAPRPEAFANVFLALTLLAIRRFERGERRLLVAFPIVALLWTQVHISVAMGLGAVALLVAASVGRAVLDRREAAPAGATAALRLSAVVLGTAALATALTPSREGPVASAWRFLTSLFGAGAADAGTGQVLAVLHRQVDELQAPSLSVWATRPFGWLVAIALLSFVVHRSRGWMRELATVLVFAAFVSNAVRFAAMAAYVAAPIAARNLGGALDRLRERRPRAATFGAAVALCVSIGCTAASPVFPAQRFGLDVVTGMLPVRAGAYLRDIGFDGRLYNDFGSGGYLEWSLDRPVFQDGRGSVRPDDLADLQPEPVVPERMARLDARYRFDALVMRAQLPPGADPALVSTLRARGLADRATWALVALDDRAAVFLRRDGRFAAAAARDEFRLVGPDGSVAPELLGTPRQREAAAEELARAARDAPGCVACRVELADVLLDARRLAEVEAIVRELRALDLQWWRPAVEVLSASLAQARGDAAEAEARYRAAIRVSDDPGPARRALASFLAARGRTDEAARLVDENLRTARDPEDLRLAVRLALARGDGARAAALEPELAAWNRREWARSRTEVGAALAEAGRRDEALAAFMEALRADGRYAPARAHLGLLLLGRGDAAAAAAELSRAVQDEPLLAEAWFGLAQAQELRADRAAALAAYRRYLALRPGGAWATAAEARIAALGGR